MIPKQLICYSIPYPHQAVCTKFRIMLNQKEIKKANLLCTFVFA